MIKPSRLRGRSWPRVPGLPRMSPDLAILRDGKKFMWDGCLYDVREDAARALQAYQAAGFETFLTDHDGQFLVYTRRVVKEVVVTQ